MSVVFDFLTNETAGNAAIRSVLLPVTSGADPLKTWGGSIMDSPGDV